MGLEEYKGDMEMCCRCSACKFVPMQKVRGYEHANICPSISLYNFHSYSGGGRLNIAAAMLRGEITYSEKLLHIVYNCQMCGACGVSCNYAMDMKVLEPISEFRIKCVEDGHSHPTLEKVITGLRENDAMLPPSGNRGEWASGLNLKYVLKDNFGILYHAGCLSSYDKERQKVARATVKILQSIGVNFGIAGEAEVCCGGRAYQMGYQSDFLKQAEKNMAMMEKAGIKTIVTSCAECYYAFKVLYAKFNLTGDLNVVHITEYLAELFHEGKLKPQKKMDIYVTYHDPCHLGRLGEPWIPWSGEKIPGERFVFDPPRIYRRGTNGVYEPPREILSSIPGLMVAEMDRTKEYSWCCGAGGGVLESNPEFAQWAAHERVMEALSTGAEAIVTACPWCEKTLQGAAAKSGRNLKVYDIVELLERSI